MKKKAISVTEAARNFADCVNRVHYQNITYVLLRNGTPLARLVPETEKSCSGRELAEALKNVALSPEEAKMWRQDLQRVRRKLKPANDKWR